MAATVVVGDTHLKCGTALAAVDRACAKMNDAPGRFVLLGDYADDWRAPHGTYREAFSDLEAWVARKRSEGAQVDVLAGNHDAAYLKGAPCSGCDREMGPVVRDTLERLGVRLAASVDGWLLTHAGVSEPWMRSMMPDVRSWDADQVARRLNALWDSDSRRVLTCGAWRGGLDRWGGPLWCDLHELELAEPAGSKQIVGHTPVETARQVDSMERDGADLWACDTMSSDALGEAVGDGSCIVVRDGEASRLALFEEGEWQSALGAEWSDRYASLPL